MGLIVDNDIKIAAKMMRILVKNYDWNYDGDMKKASKQLLEAFPPRCGFHKLPCEFQDRPMSITLYEQWAKNLKKLGWGINWYETDGILQLIYSHGKALGCV